MKLTLEHLAQYLPYELKIGAVKDYEEIRTMVLTENTSENVNIEPILRLQYKPILRPLSDLKNKYFEPEILSWFENTDSPMLTIYENENDFSIAITYTLMGEAFTDFITNRGAVDDTRYWIFRNLIKNHFDVFGLIDRNLAISKNPFEL